MPILRIVHTMAGPKSDESASRAEMGAQGSLLNDKLLFRRQSCSRSRLSRSRQDLADRDGTSKMHLAATSVAGKNESIIKIRALSARFRRDRPDRVGTSRIGSAAKWIMELVMVRAPVPVLVHILVLVLALPDLARSDRPGLGLLRAVPPPPKKKT